MNTPHTTSGCVGATGCSTVSVSTAEATAATHIWTMVSPAGEYSGEYRPSTTMWHANDNAASSTIASPYRMWNPCVSDSSANPRVASTTPMIAPVDGLRLRTTVDRIGAMTTNSPVTK